MENEHRSCLWILFFADLSSCSSKIFIEFFKYYFFKFCLILLKKESVETYIIIFIFEPVFLSSVHLVSVCHLEMFLSFYNENKKCKTRGVTISMTCPVKFSILLILIMVSLNRLNKKIYSLRSCYFPEHKSKI